MNFSLDKPLIRSWASESLAASLIGRADTGLDAAIESGALDTIPVVGLVTGAIESAGSIRAKLFVRKLAVFLQQVFCLPLEYCNRFADKLKRQQAHRRFGKAMLLLLDRAEDGAGNHGGLAYLPNGNDALLRTGSLS